MLNGQMPCSITLLSLQNDPEFRSIAPKGSFDRTLK